MLLARARRSSISAAMAAPALTSVPFPSSSTSTSESSLTSRACHRSHICVSTQCLSLLPFFPQSWRKVTQLFLCLLGTLLTRAGQGRTGRRVGRAGQDRQGWAGVQGRGWNRAAQSRAGQGKAGQGRTFCPGQKNGQGMGRGSAGVEQHTSLPPSPPQSALQRGICYNCAA